MGLFKKNKDYDNFDDYYDDQGFFVGNTDWQNGYDEGFERMPEESEHQPISVIVLTLMFSYLFFLIFGMVNTTFEDGYVPQIINVETRSQRVIYEKLLPTIDFVYEVDTFGGMPELMQSQSKESVSARIVALKLISSEITEYEKEVENVSMRLKDKDPFKLELVEITKSILSSTKVLNASAISYYEMASGFSDSDKSELESLNNEILAIYNTHQNRLLDAKNRIAEIKKYVLLIE